MPYWDKKKNEWYDDDWAEVNITLHLDTGTLWLYAQYDDDGNLYLLRPDKSFPDFGPDLHAYEEELLDDEWCGYVLSVLPRFVRLDTAKLEEVKGGVA